MRLEWLFRWWNAVYSIPLAFVLLFLTVSSVVGLVGGMFDGLGHVGSEGLGHGGSEVHSDVDIDADVDADVEVDAHLDSGHGPAEQAAHHHEPGPFWSLLAFIGVGRAPFLVTLQVLLLLWGLIGIGLHQITPNAGPQMLLWSLPVTFILSLAGTRGFATAFARMFRHLQTPGVKRNDLVGRTGQVVYSVTAEEGTVHVRDPHGALQRIRARCSHGSLEPGRQIIVLGYDPQRCLYEVDDASQFVDRK